MQNIASKTESGRQLRGTLVPREYLWPFILLTSLFAFWGVANNMTDVLLATFKKIMSMSDFQTSWIQIAFYGSYFCLALPAAIFIRRFSYKSGVMLGLGLFAAGALLFFPASQTMVYGHFLVALFILAGGLSILETSANPYAIAMGPEASATRRLNLAQSFNPLGSITGVILGKLFILSGLNEASTEERAQMAPEQLQQMQEAELAAVMGPYVTIAFIIVGVWILFAVTKFPRASDQETSVNLLPTLRRLLGRPHYVKGVIAQFFYVGAQIGVWSFTIRYVMNELEMNEASAANYYLASILLFSASRFVCTALMKILSPQRLLSIMAAGACVFTLLVVLVGGQVGAVALVGVSGCMSLMFPTIYGIAVEGLGEDAKIGASGLVMAILGGAVLTALQGQVSDLAGIHVAYLVPLGCFLIILYYGMRGSRVQTPDDQRIAGAS
ncbi:MAG: L-fucose:H+ symporter permease [Rhodothermaceae bacterium]|nr:L-fucose:H+ symporter permease [Rhodothermaceae bacterium]